MNPTAEEIRSARHALGLSVAELAERIHGVSARTISRAEAGEDVSDRSLIPIARYLKLGDFADDAGPRLREATDAELIMEVFRRLNAANPDSRNFAVIAELKPQAPPSRWPSGPPDEAEAEPEDSESSLVRQAARRRRPLRDLDHPDRDSRT